MAMLRHIPTGRLFHFTQELWDRGDMEEVTAEQLAQPPEPASAKANEDDWVSDSLFETSSVPTRRSTRNKLVG